MDPTQLELGVKKRGAKAGVEVKGLVAFTGPAPTLFEGRVQIWSKWTSEALSIDHLARIGVQKTRWLRKYDTSGADVSEVELDADERPRDSPQRLLERGCQVELVALRVGDAEEAWWGLGFEAFGEFATLEQSLLRTVAHLAPSAPRLSAGLELSYPEWLAKL